jgi:hypothetical protein
VRRGAEEVVGGHDADDLVAFDDRQVMHTGVDELHHGLVERRLGRHGLEPLSEHAGDLGLRPEPRGQHLVAKVAVGHDAQGTRVHEHRGDVLALHDLSRLADRGVPADPDRRPPDDPLHAHGQVGLEGGHLRALEAVLEAVAQPHGEVARKLRLAQQRLELGSRQPVREQVLLDHHVEGGLVRDERGVSETLALLEELDGLALDLQAHRSLADHVEMAQGLVALAHQAGARRIERDLQG